MDSKRATTPEPIETGDVCPATPSTPGPAHNGLPRTMIPPSPGDPRLQVFASGARRPTRLRAPPASIKRSQTVGVKKVAPKKPKTKVALIETPAVVTNDKPRTCLMDLPGEIRNLIYSFTSHNSRQALLVHRPRIASLRSSTRLDRQRTLASDLLDKEQDDALPTSRCSGARGNTRKPKTTLLARESNRPFFGLTQVCRLLRQEFRPMYLQRQEVGMDLVEVVQYLNTFYHDAPAHFKDLSTANNRKIDMPFTGNLTIAVGDKIKDIEKAADGVDVWPLLDLWANSFKMEAGFGRYMQAHYDATADGEAKDLYRLFGRHVQPNRSCSEMNTTWRTILRTRSLAAIRIHRKPASPASAPPPAQLPARRFVPIVPSSRPYIHILFRRDAAEPWMTEEVSRIPSDWLQARGFNAMEYFDVKVGVAPA